MSLAIAPTAQNIAAPAQTLRSVYAANAAAITPTPQPAAAPAARGHDVPAVSATAETAVRANAAYDCRVTGATETVTGFDRVAMVKQGFAHMRALFEIANAGDTAPAFTMLDARV